MGKNLPIFAIPFEKTILLWKYQIGAIAQLVEQRTENPCVPSSILGGTTERRLHCRNLLFSYICRPSYLDRHIHLLCFCRKFRIEETDTSCIALFKIDEFWHGLCVN